MFLRLFRLPLSLSLLAFTTFSLFCHLHRICWLLNGLFFTKQTRMEAVKMNSIEEEEKKNTFHWRSVLNSILSFTRERWRNVEWEKEKKYEMGRKKKKFWSILFIVTRLIELVKVDEEEWQSMTLAITSDAENRKVQVNHLSRRFFVFFYACHRYEKRIVFYNKVFQVALKCPLQVFCSWCNWTFTKRKENSWRVNTKTLHNCFLFSFIPPWIPIFNLYSIRDTVLTDMRYDWPPSDPKNPSPKPLIAQLIIQILLRSNLSHSSSNLCRYN